MMKNGLFHIDNINLLHNFSVFMLKFIKSRICFNISLHHFNFAQVLVNTVCKRAVSIQLDFGPFLNMYLMDFVCEDKNQIQQGSSEKY